MNAKLDNSGFNRITFQGCRLHWAIFLPNGIAKTKLAILAFLYYSEFVKKLLLILYFSCLFGMLRTCSQSSVVVEIFVQQVRTNNRSVFNRLLTLGS